MLPESCPSVPPVPPASPAVVAVEAALVVDAALPALSISDTFELEPAPPELVLLELAPPESAPPEFAEPESAPAESAPPQPVPVLAVSPEPATVDVVVDGSPVLSGATTTSCTERDSQPKHSARAASENPSHFACIEARG